MKLTLEVDGKIEEIKHFILIACNVDHPPFMGKVISNIDDYYVPYLLGDYSRWIFEDKNRIENK